MNDELKKKYERILFHDETPTSLDEKLLVDSAKLGALTTDPIQLYSFLSNRYPEMKSDEIQAIFLGYHLGLSISKTPSTETKPEGESWQ